MRSSEVREFLDTTLAPLLPEGWKWVPYQRDVGTLSGVTVWWKQLRIVRLAEAPIGSLRVEGTLTVGTPLTDVEKSEEELDQAVTELCAAIDGLARLSWTEATKVAVDEAGHFGWDINVWTTSTPGPATPEPDPEPAPEPDPEEGE